MAVVRRRNGRGKIVILDHVALQTWWKQYGRQLDETSAKAFISLVNAKPPAHAGVEM